MAADKGFASTLLVVGAVGIGLYALLKVTPRLLAPFHAGESFGAGLPLNSPYLPGGGADEFDRAEFAQGMYRSGNGDYYGSPISSIPTPGDFTSLDVVRNVASGKNWDGTPLTPGQQAQLMPQYDASTDNELLPTQSVEGFPDGSIPTYDAPGDDGGDSSDDSGDDSGDF